MDTASRKLLWLKVWVSNHDPKLIGRWYLEHLYEAKIISAMLRVDKGTETGTMATMHTFLCRHHNDMDPHKTVIDGPSTSNQVWKCSVYFIHTVSLIGMCNNWDLDQLSSEPFCTSCLRCISFKGMSCTS